MDQIVLRQKTLNVVFRDWRSSQSCWYFWPLLWNRATLPSLQFTSTPLPFVITVCNGGRGSGCVDLQELYTVYVVRFQDSEPTKLLYHPKQKPRREGVLRQINTCSQVPLQVNCGVLKAFWSMHCILYKISRRRKKTFKSKFSSNKISYALIACKNNTQSAIFDDRHIKRKKNSEEIPTSPRAESLSNAAWHWLIFIINLWMWDTMCLISCVSRGGGGALGWRLWP